MAKPQQCRHSPRKPGPGIDSLGSEATSTSRPRTAPDSPPSQSLPLPANDIERVLDLARWAPSGDNAQTWRFEVTGPRSARIHAWDTRDHCVYDLGGRASQLGFGALLETVVIAASRYGLRADIRRDRASPESRPLFDVALVPDPKVTPDPLADWIPIRATQRRAMSTRRLTAVEKSAMESAAGPAHRVLWLERLPERVRVARLLGLSAKLRLGLREAYETHRRVIEWRARTSQDRMPDEALGLSPLSLTVTRWAMRRWARVRLLHALPGGSLAPRLELDLIPGVACAAHMLLVARDPPPGAWRTFGCGTADGRRNEHLAPSSARSGVEYRAVADRERRTMHERAWRAAESDRPLGMDDYIATGRAWQRLWLEATRLGLWMQPEMTPLIFATYAREGIAFTPDPRARRLAERLATHTDLLLGEAVARQALVLARIGVGPAPLARSLRLPLEQLRAASTRPP